MAFGQFIQNGLGMLGQQMFPIDPSGQRPPLDPGMSPTSGAGTAPPLIDPAAAQAIQRQAMLNFGLGLMAARDDRQGLGHGVASAFGNAQAGYQQAMDNAFRNTLLKRRMDQEDKELDRQAKIQQREDRQSAAVTASRVSGALTGQYKDNPAAYWALVQSNPDVQAALQQAGVQVGETPDYGAIAQQLGTFSQTSAAPTQAKDIQLKAVIDPNTGKQVLVPESEAIGQEPGYPPIQANYSIVQQPQPDGTVKPILVNTRNATVQDLPGAGAYTPPDKNKPTAENSAAAGFLGRMTNAETQLGQYTPNWKDFMASSYVLGGNAVTSMAANKAMTPEGQKYYQAASDWVRAKLRKESGASIHKDEMDKEIRTYFPVPGDSPEVIAQKANARRIATEAMAQSAGPALRRETPTVFANDSPEAQAADQAQLEAELKRRGLL